MSIPAILAAVLLPLWPLANFVAHNRDWRLPFAAIGWLLLITQAAALLIGAVVWLATRRRLPFTAAWAAGGVASAGLMAFGAVKDMYLALGLTSGSEIWVWAIVWIALVAAAIWMARRPAVISAVAVGAVVMVLIPAVRIGVHAATRKSADEATAAAGPDAASKPAAGLPNVYYFVLDMYSRADALKASYGYDNSAFVQMLEQRGFRVLPKSHSNHHATKFSLTTTLYMDYVVPALVDGRPVSRDPATPVPILRPAPAAAADDDLFNTPERRGFTDLSVWRPYGNNRVERAGGALRVTSVGGSDAPKGMHTFLEQSQLLTSDLKPGQLYRLLLIGRPRAGARVAVGVAGPGVSLDTGGSPVDDGRREYVLDFTPTAVSGNFIYLNGMQPGDTFTIERVSLRPMVVTKASAVAEVLDRVKFDMQLTPHHFDGYLGSYQHLSPALVTFRELGYRVLFANLAGTQTDACEPYCIFGQQHLSMEALELMDLTPALEVLRLARPKVWRNITTRYQKDPADVVSKIPVDVPKPFFLFAHILSPHPPYIYDAGCNVRDEFVYELDPGVAHFRDVPEMHRMYLEQMTCVNSRMREALDMILARDPEAMIVVQGDHGFGKLESGTEEEKNRARYGILNAMRMPPSCLADAYDDMSSVNTFRLVFACLAGRRPNYVPDRMFGAPEGVAAPEIQRIDR